MKQSRIESLIESSLNTASGFVVAVLIMQFVITPLWKLPTSSLDNLAITLVFTVAAVSRNYVWRRFFNAGIHMKVHRLITGEKHD